MRNAVISLLGSAADSLFATLFPSECRFCGHPLLQVTRVPVCDACLADIRVLDVPVCQICGEALLGAARDCCGECLRSEAPFARATAYGSYAGGLRELIHLLKYEHVRPAAGVLGRMLGETISGLVAEFGPTPPVVVPVPLHASKLRQRGFNQSELIARAALKHVPVGFNLSTSALIRRRATESQTGLTRAQRRLNIRGAFEVSRSNEISGRDILLIDDVFTTGTTVSECARVLRRAGADRVWVATVARVLKPEATYALPPDAPDEQEQEAAALLSRAAHA